MKHFSKFQATEIKHSETCTVTEYPLYEELIDFAWAKVAGRYPQAGYARNLKCQEMVFIHEGKGKVAVNGQNRSLQAGDILLIEPGEKFYWEGDMTLFITCRPAWSKDQYQIDVL